MQYKGFIVKGEKILLLLNKRKTDKLKENVKKKMSFQDRKRSFIGQGHFI